MSATVGLRIAALFGPQVLTDETLETFLTREIVSDSSFTLGFPVRFPVVFPGRFRSTPIAAAGHKIIHRVVAYISLLNGRLTGEVLNSTELLN